MLAPGLQALENLRRVRASSPQAPARCILAGRTVTVLAAKPVCGTSAAAQGTAAATAAQGAAAAASQGAAATAAQGCVAISGKRLLLGCADGALEATELKPDGKQAMAAAAFVNGIAKLSEQELHWEGL
jgi:methionyl-tRNA formyltransferase